MSATESPDPRTESWPRPELSIDPLDVQARVLAETNWWDHYQVDVAETEPVEPVEPWLSERDEARLMDGRAADEVWQMDVDRDRWGRWV